MSIRTDLALEQVRSYPKEGIKGVKVRHFSEQDRKITEVIVEEEEAARNLKKPVGTYITVEPADFKKPMADFAGEVEAVAAQLQTLWEITPATTLVVGLGNRQITPDALGPMVVDKILTTRHLSRTLQEAVGLPPLQSVCAIAPGVLGQTGMESLEIVRSLCQSLRPDLIIAVDALAAQSLDRLGKTVQMSNTGIAPGSGVLNARKELSESALGIPVLSVGIPMVVDLQTVLEESTSFPPRVPPMMVTPREIDQVVEHGALTIAMAINRALQPDLTLEELQGLVG